MTHNILSRRIETDKLSSVLINNSRYQLFSTLGLFFDLINLSTAILLRSNDLLVHLRTIFYLKNK